MFCYCGLNHNLLRAHRLYNQQPYLCGDRDHQPTNYYYYILHEPVQLLLQSIQICAGDQQEHNLYYRQLMVQQCRNTQVKSLHDAILVQNHHARQCSLQD